jgi:phosphoesterase RecJ-like protein
MPKQIADTLEAAQTIMLTTTELDGDAVGAIVSLKLLIEQKWPSKSVRTITHEALPSRYECIVPDKTLFERADAVHVMPFDLAIVLDGDPDRLRDATPHYQAATISGIIDHHKSSVNAACDVALHDPQAASTTELILDLCDHLGVEVDPVIAQAIYAGLIFDTSIFRYGHTAARTLRAAARLVETGIDHRKIVEKVLLEQDADKVRLKGRMIEKMNLDYEGLYAWSTLSSGEVGDGETGGLVDELVFVEFEFISPWLKLLC